MLVAVRVVPELAQHPGAENDAESGQTAQDHGVRVLLKMVCQRRLKASDLGCEHGDHGDERAGGVAVGVHGQRGCGELLGA
ncbi:MAG: hypothetical protein H0W51_10875 [Euzebyales bacterium]|nr:hypothetical protein [Euzebyales bacterium]